MKKKLPTLIIVHIISVAFIGCGPYQSEIGKLHCGMSENDVSSALGGNGRSYYKAGTHLELDVQYNEQGVSGWMLVERPDTLTTGFSYYNVKDGHVFTEAECKDSRP